MIDWQQVNALCRDIGAVEFTEVVDLFLVELDRSVEHLNDRRSAVTEDKFHALKGTAQNLGFREFVRLCRTSETLCTRGRPELVDPGRIVRSYYSERREFLTGLPFNLSDQTSL